MERGKRVVRGLAGVSPAQEGGAVGGWCARCGRTHVVPRTAAAVEAAEALREAVYAAQSLDIGVPPKLRRPELALGALREGKMLGVAVCADGTTLRAFSGQLQGHWRVAGWAPPTAELTHDSQAFSRRRHEVEAETRRANQAQEHARRLRRALEAREAAVEDAIEKLVRAEKAEKERRRARRREIEAGEAGARDEALAALDSEAAQARRELQAAKRAHRDELDGPRRELHQAKARVDELRSGHRALSRAFHADIFASYRLRSFRGGAPGTLLDALANGGVADAGADPAAVLPKGGAGDCCAPKLLNLAGSLGLVPVGLAEFWFGPPPANGAFRDGAFYGACAERCAPILGYMLCGLDETV